MASLPCEADPSTGKTVPEITALKGDSEASAHLPRETVYAASSYRMLSAEEKNSYTRIQFTRPSKEPSYGKTERTSSSSFKPPMTKPVAREIEPSSQGTLSSALDYITTPVWYITSVFSKGGHEPETLKKTAKEVSSLKTKPGEKVTSPPDEVVSPDKGLKGSKLNPPKISSDTSPPRTNAVSALKSSKARSVSPTPPSIPASNVKIAASGTVSNTSSFRVTSREKPDPPKPKVKKDPRKLFQRNSRTGSPILTSSAHTINKEKPSKLLEEKDDRIAFPTVLPRPQPESYVMKSAGTLAPMPDKCNSAATDITNLKFPSSKPRFWARPNTKSIKTNDCPAESGNETIGPTFTVPTELPTPKKYFQPSKKSSTTLQKPKAPPISASKNPPPKIAPAKKRSPSEPTLRSKKASGEKKNPFPPQVDVPTLLPSEPDECSLPQEHPVPQGPPLLRESPLKQEHPLPQGPPVLRESPLKQEHPLTRERHLPGKIENPPDLSSTPDEFSHEEQKSLFPSPTRTTTSPLDVVPAMTSSTFKFNPQPSKMASPTEQSPKHRKNSISRAASTHTSKPPKTGVSMERKASPVASPRQEKSPLAFKTSKSTEPSPRHIRSRLPPKVESPTVLPERQTNPYSIKMGSPTELFHARIESPVREEDRNYPTFLSPTVPKSPSEQKISGTGKKFGLSKKNRASPTSKKRKSKTSLDRRRRSPQTSLDRRRRSPQTYSPPPAKKLPRYTVPTKKSSPQSPKLQSKSPSRSLPKTYTYKDVSPHIKTTEDKVKPDTEALAAAAAAVTTATQAKSPSKDANTITEQKTTQDQARPVVTNNTSKDTSTNQITGVTQDAASSQVTTPGNRITQETSVTKETDTSPAVGTIKANMATPPATPENKPQLGPETLQSEISSTQEMSYWVPQAEYASTEKINWSKMHSPSFKTSKSPTIKTSSNKSPTRVCTREASPAKMSSYGMTESPKQMSKKSSRRSFSPRNFFTGKRSQARTASSPRREGYRRSHVTSKKKSEDENYPDPMESFGRNPAHHASASTLLGEFP